MHRVTRPLGRSRARSALEGGRLVKEAEPPRLQCRWGFGGDLERCSVTGVPLAAGTVV